MDKDHLVESVMAEVLSRLHAAEPDEGIAVGRRHGLAGRRIHQASAPRSTSAPSSSSSRLGLCKGWLRAMRPAQRKNFCWRCCSWAGQ